jgi:hypothetical protein
MPSFPPVANGDIFSIYDDTTLSITGVTDTVLKRLRFTIDAAQAPIKKIIVIISGYTNNISYTASFKFSFYGNAVGSALTLTTVSASEVSLSGVLDASALTAGIHILYLYANGGNASGTATNLLCGAYGRSY